MVATLFVPGSSCSSELVQLETKTIDNIAKNACPKKKHVTYQIWFKLPRLCRTCPRVDSVDPKIEDDQQNVYLMDRDIPAVGKFHKYNTRGINEKTKREYSALSQAKASSQTGKYEMDWFEYRHLY